MQEDDELEVTGILQLLYERGTVELKLGADYVEQAPLERCDELLETAPRPQRRDDVDPQGVKRDTQIGCGRRRRLLPSRRRSLGLTPWPTGC